MCIAIYKPAGVALPDFDTLDRCWMKNSDGAGFCFVRDGTVQGYKGFMTYDDFLDALITEVDEDEPMLLHFRIATHGGVTPQGTHPFPLTSNKRALNALTWASDIGVVHNGVISGFGVSNYANTKVGLSDTQEFIAKILNDPQIRPGLFDNPAIKYLVGEATYSKWAILEASGKSVLFGHWIQDKGVWYSNDGYREKKTVWMKGKEYPIKKGSTAWDVMEAEESKYAPEMISPSDYAPKHCPKVSGADPWNCYDCQFFDEDRMWCDVFEEPVNMMDSKETVVF